MVAIAAYSTSRHVRLPRRTSELNGEGVAGGRNRLLGKQFTTVVDRTTA